MRKHPLTISLLAGLLAFGQAAAQNYSFGYSPYTGDREFDTAIAAVDALADRDVDGFINDLVNIYAAPRQEVQRLLVVEQYPPAYLWTTAATAHAIQRPWTDVFPVFEEHRGQGWGVIAKQLGIKPGSPAFHAMKADLGKRQSAWQTRDGHRAHAGSAIEPGVGHGKPAKAKTKTKAKAAQQGKEKSTGKGKSKAKAESKQKSKKS